MEPMEFTEARNLRRRLNKRGSIFLSRYDDRGLRATSPKMACLLGALVTLLHLQAAYAVGSLTVETTSGPVTGFINGTTPHVAQFLGIPYAEPPVGSRRWLPSIIKSREDS